MLRYNMSLHILKTVLRATLTSSSDKSIETIAEALPKISGLCQVVGVRNSIHVP
jgi:hypothetical protein